MRRSSHTHTNTNADLLTTVTTNWRHVCGNLCQVLKMLVRSQEAQYTIAQALMWDQSDVVIHFDCSYYYQFSPCLQQSAQQEMFAFYSLSADCWRLTYAQWWNRTCKNQRIVISECRCGPHDDACLNPDCRWAWRLNFPNSHIPSHRRA